MKDVCCGKSMNEAETVVVSFREENMKTPKAVTDFNSDNVAAGPSNNYLTSILAQTSTISISAT
jgi:hypothetical protein